MRREGGLTNNSNVMFFHTLKRTLVQVRRVARSWKRGGGGLFWKSEKSANDLDPNFHCSWISFTRFVRKLRRRNLNVFFQSVSSSVKTFFFFFWRPPEFGRKKRLNFRFRPKIQSQFRCLQKKKKVFTKIETDFWAKFGNSNVSAGAIFNFSQKIGLKSTKNVRFCILHKPMRGARAPPAPPGYATASSGNVS